MEVVGSNDEVNRQQEQGPEGSEYISRFVRFGHRIRSTCCHFNLHSQC